MPAMNRLRRISIAASLISMLATPAAAAHCGAHPPIYVATPRTSSPITPYVFPYGATYRYNSPGPVACRLPDWEPHHSCRLWRYNYLYWTC
jgi:hypothetical protein